MQDQFVVFSGFGEASSALDIGCSRNDLISVGDLALARSLLYDRHHDQSASNLGEQSGGFIPLMLPTPSPLSATKSVERWDEPATSCSGEHVTDNQAGHIDGCATGNDMKKCCRSSAVQPFDRFDEEPEVLAHCESLWAWDDLLPRREGHCNDGSLQRFEVAKSAVSETVAPIRDEQETPSSPRAAPVVVGPQLNEAKRLEFLRALDDFKRCLRPASSPSSLLSVGSAHLFQAPNVIRSPVAVLARFYLAPAHLYQPRKSFKAPQRSYFTVLLLLLNFFSLRTIVAASKQRQFASVSPPLNLL
ncbi:hypothetical protein PF011_g14675, partial [Phytophthora fragariae]